MLSEERRKQLVSRVKELAEENRVTIRNIRRETNKKIEGLEKGGGVAEDEAKDLKEKVQDLTRSFEKKVDEIVDKKTKDVLEF
jgi:ribosome recycling factor